LAQLLVGTIGTNVRLFRSEHGWSRKELARRASLNPQTVSNIERGIVEWPQSVTLWNLANAFGISPGELRNPKQHEEREAWRSHLASLEQQQLGARWVEDDGHFSIDPAGTQSDITVAREHIVQQLHEAVIQKSRLFNDASKRLDNTLGWHGIAAASKRFVDGVQRPTQDLPNHLGSIYSAILELGSFLEQDLRLQRGSGYSADPLDPEVHRVLGDLIRTAAPWLRQFPTVRELDDQSGAFLTREDLLDPGAALIRGAQNNELVSSTDAAAIHGLVEAARRGEFQGEKARTRGVFSVRNLLYIATTTVVVFLGNAAASNYSEKSPVVDHAGRFLAQSEEEITKFVADLPDDLKIAFQQLIKEVKDHPEIFTPP
jgi:transcriptional regulator with XRE-family HTH domain